MFSYSNFECILSRDHLYWNCYRTEQFIRNMFAFYFIFSVFLRYNMFVAYNVYGLIIF